jgi:hypothetical protein
VYIKHASQGIAFLNILVASCGGWRNLSEYKGPGIAVGYRNNVSDSIEIFGRLGVYGGDHEESTQLDAGILWNINDTFGISFAYEYFEYDEDEVEIELDQVQVGARFSF